MFGPIYPVPGICRTEEHTIKQNTKRDDENPVAMFAKPIIITRGQEDEELLSGFCLSRCFQSIRSCSYTRAFKNL